MAHISLQTQIALRAQHLADFLSEETRKSSLICIELGIEKVLPGDLTISGKIRDLHQMIFHHAQSAPLRRMHQATWQILGNGLIQSIEKPEMQTLEYLSETLRSVQQLASHYLAAGPVLPPPRPPTPPIPHEAPPLLDMVQEPDEPIALEVWQDSVASEVERVTEVRNDEIYFKQPEDLRMIDRIMSELCKRPPWEAAIGEYHPRLFELLAGLLEGRMIQTGSASYQDYCQKKGGQPPITNAEYAWIQGISFDALAEEMSKDLAGQPINDALIHLKTEGYREPRIKERLICLAIERQEKLAEQKELLSHLGETPIPDLIVKFDDACRSESHDFIDAVWPHLMGHVSDKTLIDVFEWMASRGKTEHLTTILDRKARAIPREQLLKSMQHASLDGHEAAFQLLFSRYPHRNKAAENELFTRFVEWGMKDRLPLLLSPQYPHKFSPKAINDAFSLLCNSDDYETLKLFHNSDVLSDESVYKIFANLISNENMPWEELGPHFQAVAASPLYDRLPIEDLRFFVETLGKDGETSLIRAFLESRRGGDIDQPTFENTLMKAAEAEKWSTVLALLDHPRYQGYSKELLGFLFTEAVRHREEELLLSILRKNPPLHRLSRHDLNKALFMTLKIRNLNGAESIAPYLRREDIDSDLLLQETLRSAKMGNLDTLKFLCKHFNSAMTLNIRKAAYKAAQEHGQPAVEQYFWERLRESYLYGAEPSPSTKRPRTT